MGYFEHHILLLGAPRSDCPRVFASVSRVNNDSSNSLLFHFFPGRDRCGYFGLRRKNFFDLLCGSNTGQLPHGGQSFTRIIPKDLSPQRFAKCLSDHNFQRNPYSSLDNPGLFFHLALDIVDNYFSAINKKFCLSLTQFQVYFILNRVEIDFPAKYLGDVIDSQITHSRNQK